MRAPSRRTLLYLLARGVSNPRLVPGAPIPITVAATPIDRFRINSDDTRFGQLEFRGGLVLTSDYSGFGGISALTLDGRENFLAVTDAGVFLSGRIVTAGDRPTGLADVRAAALLDSAGKPLAGQKREDSESLAVAPDGSIYVGLETINEIWRYPGPDPLGQKGARIEVPAAVHQLRRNTGLESLVYVSDGALKGTLIGIGEEGASGSDDLPGFLIGGPSPGVFSIAKSGWFDATDAAIGPGQTLYLLERHYAPTTGVSAQVRRFRLADIRPGARIEGETLFTGDMAYEIDNMEGIAVTRNAAGETLLTLVSDDNFSLLQRTILLRFAVPG